jgi:hypothetical protein
VMAKTIIMNARLIHWACPFLAMGLAPLCHPLCHPRESLHPNQSRKSLRPNQPRKSLRPNQHQSRQPTKQALVAAVAPMIGATTKTPTSKRPTSKRPTTKVPTKQVAQMSTTKPTECVLVCPSAPGTPIPDGMCAEIWQPVCDCNGNQWSNACMATNAGITSFCPANSDDECVGTVGVITRASDTIFPGY